MSLHKRKMEQKVIVTSLVEAISLVALKWANVSVQSWETKEEKEDGNGPDFVNLDVESFSKRDMEKKVNLLLVSLKVLA